MFTDNEKVTIEKENSISVLWKKRKLPKFEIPQPKIFFIRFIAFILYYIISKKVGQFSIPNFAQLFHIPAQPYYNN